MYFKNKTLVGVLIAVSVVFSITHSRADTSAKPAIKKITLSGPYSKGAAFSIEVSNFGDLTKGTPEVNFSNNKKAQVTNIAEGVIQGVLPDGIEPKGGPVSVILGSKSARWELKVPAITSVFLPGNTQSGDFLVISGVNFEPQNCQVKIGAQSLTSDSCDYTQIRVKIENRLEGGDLTVTSYGFTSQPYPVSITTPKITFIENTEGIQPGGHIRIHGSGFQSAGSAPEVFLNTTRLRIVSGVVREDLLEVELPTNSFSGAIKVIRGGLESNTLILQSQKAPIVTSYLEQRGEGGVTNLILKGKNFSPTASENSVYVNNSSIAPSYAELNTITSPLPANIEPGCLSVTTNATRSNCVYYEPKEGPRITEIGSPELDNEGNYRITVSGFNFADLNKTSLYAKNAKQELVGILGSSNLIARFSALPKEGTMYVISNGIKSNEVKFDFKEVGVPIINKITAPQGFKPGQKIIVEGTNFGRQSDRPKISLVISNGGISDDVRIKPYSIEAYLDSKATLYQPTTFYMTFNGEKSNEIKFSFDPTLQTVSRGPLLKKIIYPEGTLSGSKIKIEGSGFDPMATKNIVYIRDQQIPALESKSNNLIVVIPENISTGGDLYVEANGQKSNSLTFTAAGKNEKKLEMRFENLEKESASLGDPNSAPVTLARLSILNHVGRIKIKRIAFQVSVKENSELADSFKKSGVLPLGTIELRMSNSNASSGPITTAAQCGLGKCQIVFRELTLMPATERQIIEISAAVSSFAQNNSKIVLSLSPQDRNDFTADNLETDEPLSVTGLSGMVSPEVTLYNQVSRCLDTENNRRNCNIFLNSLEKPAPKNLHPAASPSSSAVINSTVLTPKRIRKTLTPIQKSNARPRVPFRDAGSVPWAQSYINELKTKNIVEDSPENQFYPSEPIKKIDFLTYLLRALQIDVVDKVAWAKKYGLLEPSVENRFVPEGRLLRGEAARMLLAAGGFKVNKIEASMPRPFKDVALKKTPWAMEAVKRGLMSASSPERFEPNRAVSRAEAAKMILETVKQYSEEVKQDQEIEVKTAPGY